MRIFDFIGQTFLFLIGLFCLALGHEALVFIGFLQFFVGIWQLISAIATTANLRHGDPQRSLLIRVYWIAVGIYFVILAALGMLVKELALVWFFSAWLIAIYYYILIIRITFLSPKRTGFMDVMEK
jgi:hypothetical protein